MTLMMGYNFMWQYSFCCTMVLILLYFKAKEAKTFMLMLLHWLLSEAVEESHFSQEFMLPLDEFSHSSTLTSREWGFMHEMLVRAAGKLHAKTLQNASLWNLPVHMRSSCLFHIFQRILKAADFSVQCLVDLIWRIAN